MSPWLLGIVARIGRMLPPSWRSDLVSRRRREAIERVIDRAMACTGDVTIYRHWSARLRDWASIAAEGRLHDLPPARFDVRDPDSSESG